MRTADIMEGLYQKYHGHMLNSEDASEANESMAEGLTVMDQEKLEANVDRVADDLEACSYILVQKKC